MEQHIFSSSSPAGRFGEAYPLGNGKTGAMVFSSPGMERLLLSGNSFFSGEPSVADNREGAIEAFRKVRSLIKDGAYAEAEKEAGNFIGVKNNYGTNLPVGDLVIGKMYDASKTDAASVPVNFTRELDIRDGIAGSSCSFGNGDQVNISMYIPSRENLLVCGIDSSFPLDISLSFKAYSDEWNVTPTQDGLIFSTRAVEKLHSDGKCGVTLFGKLRVITDGRFDHERLSVAGAGKTSIILAMTTDFQCRGDQFAQRTAACSGSIDSLRSSQLRRIRETHRKEMRELYSRSELELETRDESASIVPRLYHYGRYLLYSSSRPGSALPAHLQGIWNDNVACRIGWTCDMHLDINTEMNYWPAGTTGIPEVQEPLFSWIENILIPQGRKAARESYGLPGWSADIVSNAWGYAAPYWAVPITASPGNGIWILTHFFEHFLFTEDMEFLSNRAYPLIEEAMEFFVEYLFENDGFYTGGPSTSPENSFLIDKTRHFLSIGPTFENLMVRELFSIYLAASEIVGAAQVNSRLKARVVEIQEKLIPYRITAAGTIAEWNHDYPAADSQHRHTSHLLGLYPFAQITPEGTPELAEAAYRTIRQKLDPRESWEDTGWARSMLMLYCARLHKGEDAWDHAESMICGLLEPNGMIIHPPTRGAPSFDNVYELDGNTGFTAGVAEMLLQSHNGVIHLLPALPEAWQAGRVAGLRARGNITVDISWREGELVSARVKPAAGKRISIRYRERILERTVPGQTILEVSQHEFT